jgi:8-oxo-dGTP pyrophosphatase MutT (NUDIX family)
MKPQDTTTRHAATVVLLRDGARSLEVLMVQRDAKLAFAGGHWVFPGGRIDPSDRDPLAPDDELAAARRAAVREAREETRLELREGDLVPFSHWTPPDMVAKRYLTWFFISRAPEGEIVVDQQEIRRYAWMEPQDVLARRNAGEIELSPPTWITLEQLLGLSTVELALAQSRGREPEHFTTKIALTSGGAVAVYHGDAGYESLDLECAGGRHRLWMLATGWRYERDT